MALGMAGPGWASDAFTAGLELFGAGNWEQAAGEMLEAVAQAPSDPVVRMTAGVALASIRHYPKAAEQFEAAAQLAPGCVLPMLLLDGTYGEMGNAVRSRRSRDQANQVLGKGTKSVSATTADEQILLAALAKHPGNAIAHCLLGDLYQLQGRLAEARERYEKARALAPRWVKPVFNLGLANLQVDPKAAEANLEAAAKLDPDNLRVHLWRGDVFLQQGKYNEAVAAYNLAARDKSLAADARTRIGNAGLRAGDYQAAQQQFDQAAKSAPTDPRPIAGQAQVYQNEGKLAEAEQWYVDAAQVLVSNQAMPESQAVVQRQIGVVQAQQGKLDQAVESFKQSLTLHPTLDNAYALVEAEQKDNRLAEGIAHYEAVLKKDSRNLPALLYLLKAYKLSGNTVGRVDVAGRLIKLDAANAIEYYAELGSAHAAAGSTSQAVEAYVRGLEAANAASWSVIVSSAAESGAIAPLRERCEKLFKASGKVRTGMILFDLQSAQNDVSAMLATAERLVKTNPEMPTLWLRLGEAHERRGNKQMALIAYAKAAAGTDPEAAALARARSEEISK